MALPRFRFFFTPAGFAVLVIALFVLIRSLSTWNPYEILLSSAALLLLLVLGILGAWKSRRFEAMEAAWKLPFPFTANAGEETVITGFASPVPRFFRFHFIVRGRFFPAGSSYGCKVYAESSVPRGDVTGRLTLDFPLSGVFRGTGFCRLCDIFGFFSFSCGIPQHKIVKVRSAPCFTSGFPISVHAGAEDRRYKNSSDEERYYMREYSPGDRLRDINWKSSERIDTLVTRISPENQEKINRIEVYFRNYGSVNRSSLKDLWLLDRAKARLSLFLRNFKEENTAYVFLIHTAQGDWEINNQEELEVFLEELAGFSFFPPQNEPFTAGTLGEIVVFSTACDIGLSGFLLACQPKEAFLFLVQPAITEKENIETLYTRDFLAKGCIPFLRWFFPGTVKPLNAASSRMELSYAELRL